MSTPGRADMQCELALPSRVRCILGHRVSVMRKERERKKIEVKKIREIRELSW